MRVPPAPYVSGPWFWINSHFTGHLLIHHLCGVCPVVVLGVEMQHVVLLCREDGGQPSGPSDACSSRAWTLPHACSPGTVLGAWTGHTAFVTEETSVSFVGNWGPHLVVVRSCNILKWELELKRWCPGLKTLLYVGSHRELKAKRQVCYFKREKEWNRKVS